MSNDLIVNKTENLRRLINIRSGERRISRDKKKCYRDNKRLKVDNEKLQKMIYRLSKRQQRLKKALNDNYTLSPKTSFKKSMKGYRIGRKFGKKLFLGQILVEQMRNMYEENKGKASRLALKKILCGKIIKKIQADHRISTNFWTYEE